MGWAWGERIYYPCIHINLRMSAVKVPPSLLPYPLGHSTVGELGKAPKAAHDSLGLRCNQQCMYVYRLVPTVIGIPHAHSRITHLCSMHTAAQEPGTTCSRNYTWQYTTELVLGHCCTRLLAHKLGHSKLGSQENHLYNHQVATRSGPDLSSLYV